MDTKKKWITFGAIGVVGLGILAGGAAATAASMDLRSTDGTVLPGGAITGRESGVLDRSGVQMNVTDTSVSVVSVASVVTPPSVPTAASVASPITPPPAPAPAPAPAQPAPAPVYDSPASIPSAASAASVASVASAGSN